MVKNGRLIMSRRNNRIRQAKASAPNTAQTGDSYQNFAARVGMGTQNQNSASQYGFSPISRNRVQLEFAYRSSWLAGQAVDTYADDMTREELSSLVSCLPMRWSVFKGFCWPANLESAGRYH